MGRIDIWLWIAAGLYIADYFRCWSKDNKHKRNVTRLKHEPPTPNNLIDFDCRSIESMADDSQNKIYSQQN